MQVCRVYYTTPNSQGTYMYMYMCQINLSGSAFCMRKVGVPEQALGWFPPILGIAYRR